MSGEIREKVFWTTKMNLHLINFMKSLPFMWDKRHKSYTKLRLRQKAFSEFAKLYGNKFTAYRVKERWSNIRCCYARHCRRINELQKSNPFKVYNPKWELWDALKFLSKTNSMRTKECRNDVVRRKNDEVSSIEDVHEDYDNVIKDEDAVSENEALTTQSVDFEGTDCRNLAKSIVEAIQTMQSDLFGIKSTKFDKLGNLITAKLIKLDPNKSMELIKKIVDILLKYESEENYTMST